MDSSAVPTSLGVTLQRGIYDSVSQKFSGLTPVAYIDAPLGNIRRTSLLADGRRPTQLQTSAKVLCQDSIDALNFSDPSLSQIAVLAAGGDGVCGSRDDEQWIVGFDANYSPRFTYYAPGKILGYLRSASTGQPTAWLDHSVPGQLSLFSIGGGVGSGAKYLNATPLPQPAIAPVYRSVLNLNDQILFTENGVLRSVKGSATSATLADLSALTGPDGWQSAGFDASNAYVYLNSNPSTSGSGTWRMLAVSRLTQSTSLLATGTGSVLTADTGIQGVFATVLKGATSSIIEIAKSSGAQSVFRSDGSSSVSFLSAFPGGINVLTVANNSNSASAASVVTDSGARLFDANTGLLYGADERQYDSVANSFVSSSLLFVTPFDGFGGRGMSGSNLVAFDLTARTTRLLGTFPTGAGLGGLAADTVFVGPMLSNNSFGGTQVARLVGGQMLASGSAVYTYNAGVPNSLRKTTVQVR
ncbi:MAG: hypothetical protein V4772_00265 [Pseudomonadota bacterium]